MSYAVGDRVRYDDSQAKYIMGNDIWEGEVVRIDSYDRLCITINKRIEWSGHYFRDDSTNLKPTCLYLSLIHRPPTTPTGPTQSTPPSDGFNKEEYDKFMRNL